MPTHTEELRGTIHSLKGIQKAAVLLVALGTERAGEVFKRLSEQEMELLFIEIAKLQKVPQHLSKDVVAEAVESVLAEDYIAEGGVEYAKSVLERSLGKSRADGIIGRLSATIERRPFEFLRRTPAEQIAVFLRQESRRRSPSWSRTCTPRWLRACSASWARSNRPRWRCGSPP